MVSLDPARIRPEVAGKIMLTVAAVGVIVGLGATVVGWRLAGHLFDGVDDSLAVATQSIESVDDSITVLERFVVDVRAGVATVDASLGDVVNVTEASAGALDDLSTQAPVLADGVESLRDGLDGIGDAAETIDRTLEAVDDIPGTPDYAPAEPLDETVRDLSDDLAGVADALRVIDTNVQDVDAAVQPLVDNLRQAREDLAALDRDLADSIALLDEYRMSAEQANAVALRTQDGLESDVLATRILIVLAGTLFVIGQIVPYWLGRTILLEVAAAKERVEDEESVDQPA